MKKQYIRSLIISAISILCYYNTFNCGFVFDDISAIKENRDLRPHTPWKNVFFNDFWGTAIHKEQSHKSYRPLCVITFRLNYYLQQLDPYGYHIVNVMLHTVVSLLYLKMCSMFLPDLPSFVATVLFTVHPIHTEAVTGVVGRAETLSSVFFLSAFIFYVNAAKNKSKVGWQSLCMTVVCITSAMLCKEQGITMTAICAVYEIFVRQKVRLNDFMQLLRWILNGKPIKNTWAPEATKRLCVLTAVTISLLFLRILIMGAKLPIFTRFRITQVTTNLFVLFLSFKVLEWR